MNKFVYLNGQLIPSHEAKISIFDRGFLFADSVYEVIPVYTGRPFFLEQHLKRLQSSLEQARIASPSVDWENVLSKLIERNGNGDMQLYIQVTRGNQGMRKHDIPSDLQPTVIAFTIHNNFPGPLAAEGLHAVILEDYRWHRCDIKTTALLANVLLNDDAVRQGGDTSILCRDGFITEGSASNIFLVGKDNIIRTPPLTHYCLPGITREITLNLIHSLKWKVLEEPIPVQDVFTASELWITSTTKEIYPVTRVNRLQIGDGKGGKYWQQINTRYKELVRNYE
ncbi:D-alanine-aminotransferase [Legionella birminghamensis]|uniref:Aminodeoxychorismate lyase n=1 Tax=Legionella birminghamensis TaxID=28083 RepID=A0A378I9C7_9GAMM|nr:D-amino acid aminotransferase [Legionella birminghamensis]KTC75231.1 D-alanine-aminotransferase [Legionella birminghamensis]STX31818.1 D-alanine transaminase [Legionella birminghamensis]